MSKSLAYIPALLMLLLPLSFLANDPEGWEALKHVISNTPCSQVSELQGKTFDLIVPGADYDYTLQVLPAGAFRVDRLNAEKFRATIVHPDTLVNKTTVPVYFPIGWKLQHMEHIPSSMRSTASCSSAIVFRQQGIGELDLSTYGSDYRITYELSLPSSIAVVERQGKGYTVTRVANSIDASKIRVHIQKKSDHSEMQTDWSIIPVCPTSKNMQYLPVVKDAAALLPKDALEITIASSAMCPGATDAFCTTLQIDATNTGDQTVRCNRVWFYLVTRDQIIASASRPVELAPQQNTTFTVTLTTPQKPASSWSYKILKYECLYE